MATRLSANLSTMFQELPFLDRFAAAARAGFTGVEFVSPYAETVDAVRSALIDSGLSLALFNFPAGDWAAGERGFAADPARTEEFRESVPLALRYAEACGCSTLHLLAGKIPADADRDAWGSALVENVRYAADALRASGRTVVLEPINTKVDVPGYFYSHSESVLAVIRAADRSNVKLLFDAYHLQIMEGDLASAFKAHFDEIGHVQIAEVPGRHEPGDGEVNWPWLLSFFDRSGYTGWIGCEYIPRAGTAAGLGWATPYLAPAAGVTRDGGQP